MPKTVDKNTGEILPVIRTWRNPPKVKAVDFSDSIIQHHDFIYDSDTRGLKIVETEKEDRDAYIQSFAKETGIYNILKKYSKTGDASILNVKEGFYGDMTKLPEDNLDPAAAAKAAEQALGGLNKALGSQLTAEQLAKMSSEELNDLISKAVQAAASKTEVKEVKENA